MTFYNLLSAIVVYSFLSFIVYELIMQQRGRGPGACAVTLTPIGMDCCYPEDRISFAGQIFFTLLFTPAAIFLCCNNYNLLGFFMLVAITAGNIMEAKPFDYCN